MAENLDDALYEAEQCLAALQTLMERVDEESGGLEAERPDLYRALLGLGYNINLLSDHLRQLREAAKG